MKNTAEIKSRATVSLIMPLLNEGKILDKCLQNVSKLMPQPLEIIAVDGGSSDDTLKILKSYPDIKVIQVSVANRSYQMHEGAKTARGDIFCFLHADTFLVPNSVDIMRSILANDDVVMAGFTSLMVGEKGIQHITTFHNFLKTYYAALLFRPLKFFRGGRLLFGDQAMFCDRNAYFASGGYDPEMPIMEEADLCDRICQYGKIKQIPFPVYSSDRRVEKWGVLKANLIYLYIGLMWGIGYSPHKLKKLFTDIR